ncbi:hypothetical protein AB0G32_13530 [Streptomyces sp. NPDC023723]|uniref:hypothetical protein n=1 Tax=Streptomyces sp. NPDC023723 TaxID=3154323 RepID=UPI0033CA7642
MERLEELGDRGGQVGGVDRSVFAQGGDSGIDGRVGGALFLRGELALSGCFGDLGFELERDQVQHADRPGLQQHQAGRAWADGAAEHQGRHRALAVSDEQQFVRIGLQLAA